MEIESAAELKDVLKRLADTLKENGMVEHSDKFVFCDDKIFVFNGEIHIEANFKTGLKGAVEGKSFLKYIEKMASSRIDLQQAEGELTVTKGSATATFPIEEEELNSPISEIPIRWSEAPENFIQSLITCQYTTSKDQSDIVTTVIHFKEDFAESSDSIRITRFELDKEIKGEFFIPATAVKFLTKSKITHYFSDEQFVIFKNQLGDVISLRCIFMPEEYPALSQFIEECSDGEEVTLPESLYHVVEKAGVFQDSVKNECDKNIKIVCKNGKLKVVSESEKGKFNETIKVDFKDNFNFEINPSFMMQIIEKSMYNRILLHSDYIKVIGKDFVYLTSIASE